MIREYNRSKKIEEKVMRDLETFESRNPLRKELRKETQMMSL